MTSCLAILAAYPQAFQTGNLLFACLFGVASVGVYPAIAVANYAVGSYPTISPLPYTTSITVCVWRYIFCGTFPTFTANIAVCRFCRSTLSTNLPYDVQTFLGNNYRNCPAPQLASVPYLFAIFNSYSHDDNQVLSLVVLQNIKCSCYYFENVL